MTLSILQRVSMPADRQISMPYRDSSDTKKLVCMALITELHCQISAQQRGPTHAAQSWHLLPMALIYRDMIV